ncbi:hypothetical protein BX600DRAFT_470496 [Xylariales sp. PMI_506]|nr:hypothetical protein BX600DRAFT_470496 [Xylariales sp. PMI_506]
MALPDHEINRGLQVIHASLFRMGTKSMAEAYQILGFKTFHALDDPMGAPWVLVEQAAEATWPFVPDAYPRPPFTRADWDELWGAKYDAVCDLSGPFTPELIKAYPDAKVVIVQRDFETWWPSFRSEIIGTLFTPFSNLQFFLAWNLLGFRSGHAMTKMLFGFFNANTQAEIEANGRETYEEHFRKIRNITPPERLLEYKLGSGWESLCEFLGKEIPDVPFPRSNDRKAHSNDVQTRKKRIYYNILKNVGFWSLSILVLGAAYFWFVDGKKGVDY